jgi:hypothetical protein
MANNGSTTATYRPVKLFPSLRESSLVLSIEISISSKLRQSTPHLGCLAPLDTRDTSVLRLGFFVGHPYTILGMASLARPETHLGTPSCALVQCDWPEAVPHRGRKKRSARPRTATERCGTSREVVVTLSSQKSSRWSCHERASAPCHR